MDEGLFKKHILRIQVHKEGKDEVLKLLEEKTGIIFSDKECIVSKKTITFTISSVQRNFLHSKKIDLFLKEKGYTIKL